MSDRRYENGDSEGRDASAPLPMGGPSGSPERMRPRGGREPPAGRVYVGNLPSHADKKTVEDLFGKFGRIVEISIKRTISGSPFAFVEFEDSRDAQDAIQERDGYKIDGCVLRVEVPFASRSGPRGDGNRGRFSGPPRRADFRVCVKGLPPSGSWQDLKDHMREAGDCVYADVFRNGTGIVEFSRREDMDYAIRHFGNSKFRSHEGETSYITVTRLEDEDGRYSRYDERRSPDRGRYRGRSPYWEGRDYRGGYDKSGHDSGYGEHSRRGRSYSRGRYRRSESRTHSRSRSFRRHR